MIGTNGRRLKIVGPIIFPPCKLEKTRYFGGDLSYWSEVQRKAHEQVNELFEKMTDPALNKEDRLPQLPLHVDSHAFSLILFEMIFKNKFWWDGSQDHILQKIEEARILASKGQVTEVRIIPRLFVELCPHLQKLIKPNGGPIDIKNLLSHFLEKCIDFFSKSETILWEPYVY